MINPSGSRAFLFLLATLLTLFGGSALAQNGDEEIWAPTPPRVSYIDGEASYWRQGMEDWAAARVNLPLAEGDALYAGPESNFEVQFGSRSFVRADENSQLALVGLEEGHVQFEVTGGRVSFDMRRIPAGSRLEVSTPNAVFLIEDPGYYRVEVGSSDTHFITRRGGEATLTTADGRTLSVYPSEDIVVTTGNPVRVATYAAPPPDAWDQWNDARSERIGESVSARYLPPDVYGAEELDHYGSWRVVDTYGAVWVPAGVSASWAPYSTGYWVWDPYYEWTWVDDEPWGWAPFHYGRWVFIDGYWAWAPGPVVRRPVYAPALVGFMVAGSGISLNVRAGLPGIWWVALGWGEPLVPWWQRHKFHGHPRWDGWGGPRIVNDRSYREGPSTRVTDIRYHNANLPRHAVVTVPPDKFGRERQPATVETRFRSRDFTPLAGEVPIRPSRESLYGGAPKGIQPPREIVSRPVVTTRPPRQRAAQPWQQEQMPKIIRPSEPQQRFVITPEPKRDERRPPQRPPFGSDTGPELTPPPQPPRYDDMKRTIIVRPPFNRSEPAQPPTREQQEQRREPAIRSAPPPSRVEQGGERREQQLPRVERGGELRGQPQQPRIERNGGQREQPQLPRIERNGGLREQPQPQPPRIDMNRERGQQQPPRIDLDGGRREQVQPQPQPRINMERREQARPLPGRPANQPHQRRERN